MGKRSKRRICYLCGAKGADSKDHLPPKALLPDGSNSFQRITVPAHRRCNSLESADEEYVRDLIVPESYLFGFPETRGSYEKVWRGWSRDQGWQRYQRFLENYKPIELQTPSGLFAGKAIGVAPDLKRVKRVGAKIIRGLVFHDSGAMLEESGFVVVPLRSQDAMELKTQDSDARPWQMLSLDGCQHTRCGQSSMMRRVYIGHPIAEDQVVIECHFAIMLWSLFYLASGSVPLSAVTRKDFKFLIDESSGAWIREPSQGKSGQPGQVPK